METSRWEEALAGDPELERLIEALGYAEGFSFHLMLCDRPAAVPAALAITTREVTALRGEEVSLQVLDPYAGRAGRITEEALSERVLARLVDPDEALGSPQALVAVQGAAALQEEDEVWARLFSRMNQRRNLIVRKLKGALLLCLPPRLEPVFAHSAPDFWSIRGTAVVIDVTVARESLALLPLPPPPLLPADPDRWARLLKESMPRPGTSGIEEAMALCRLARFDLERGDLAAAWDAAQRAYSRLDYGWDEAVRFRKAAALDLVASVAQTRGDKAAAQAARKECLWLLCQGIAAPDEGERLGLAESLRRAMGLGGYLGQHEQVVRWNDEAIALAAAGAIDKAHEVLEEACALARRIADSVPPYQPLRKLLLANLAATQRAAGRGAKEGA